VPVFWFLVKLLALLFTTMWVRASLPRMRYDRLMALGWKYLIEIAVLWLMVVAAFEVGLDQNWRWAAPIALVIGLLAYGVLYAAMPKRGEQLEEFR
jgi:NADH-quinone oxidoreductase subunit H